MHDVWYDIHEKRMRSACYVDSFDMETNMNMNNGSNSGMDIWSKALLSVFAIAILVSVAVSYHVFMVKRDYAIDAHVDCDPTSEKCFVEKCDPTSEDVSTMCTGNPKEDTTFYKIIHKNAMRIPVCDSRVAECASIGCDDGEPDCSYSLCENDNKDGASCSTAEDAAAATAAPADNGASAVDQPADGAAATTELVPSDQTVPAESVAP